MTSTTTRARALFRAVTMTAICVAIAAIAGCPAPADSAERAANAPEQEADAASGASDAIAPAPAIPVTANDEGTQTDASTAPALPASDPQGGDTDAPPAVVAPAPEPPAPDSGNSGQTGTPAPDPRQSIDSFTAQLGGKFFFFNQKSRAPGVQTEETRTLRLCPTGDFLFATAIQRGHILTENFFAGTWGVVQENSRFLLRLSVARATAQSTIGTNIDFRVRDDSSGQVAVDTFDQVFDAGDECRR